MPPPRGWRVGRRVRREVNDYQLAEVHIDAGISGSSMEGRDGLAAALEAAGKGQALVVYSIGRLARSTRDMQAIAESSSSARAPTL